MPFGGFQITQHTISHQSGRTEQCREQIKHSNVLHLIHFAVVKLVTVRRICFEALL